MSSVYWEISQKMEQREVPALMKDGELEEAYCLALNFEILLRLIRLAGKQVAKISSSGQATVFGNCPEICSGWSR